MLLGPRSKLGFLALLESLRFRVRLAQAVRVQYVGARRKLLHETRAIGTRTQFAFTARRVGAILAAVRVDVCGGVRPAPAATLVVLPVVEPADESRGREVVAPRVVPCLQLDHEHESVVQTRPCV